MKLLLPLLGFGLLAAVVVRYITNAPIFRPTEGNIKNLADRMNAYAELSNSNIKSPEVFDSYARDGSVGTFLNKEGHAILLGTLKKVEGKNASLVTVIAFLLGFVLASLVALTIGVASLRVNPQPISGSTISFDVQALKALVLGLASASLASLYPLYSAIAGMRQIDQRDFQSIKCPEKKFVMQKMLMRDLLLKEWHFRSARFAISCVVGFVVVVVFLIALLVSS